MRGTGRFGADYEARLNAAKKRQAHQARLRSIEMAKQKREKAFSATPPKEETKNTSFSKTAGIPTIASGRGPELAGQLLKEAGMAFATGMQNLGYAGLKKAGMPAHTRGNLGYEDFRRAGAELFTLGGRLAPVKDFMGNTKRETTNATWDDYAGDFLDSYGWFTGGKEAEIPAKLIYESAKPWVKPVVKPAAKWIKEGHTGILDALSSGGFGGLLPAAGGAVKTAANVPSGFRLGGLAAARSGLAAHQINMTDDETYTIPEHEALPGEVPGSIIKPNEHISLGLEDLPDDIRGVLENNPRLQKLIEDNPDRLDQLHIFMSNKKISDKLSRVDELYNLSSGTPTKPFRLSGVSSEVVDAFRRGENPLELLLDGRLSKADFSVKGGQGHTITVRPLNEKEYAIHQGRTAYGGRSKILKGTRTELDKQQRKIAAAKDRAVLNQNYDDALAAGNVPYSVQVIGGKRGYKGWHVGQQQEHSIPKSVVRDILTSYFHRQWVSEVKIKGAKLSEKEFIDLKLDNTPAVNKAQEIINAPDTLITFPSDYNRIKGNKTTKEFQDYLLKYDPKAYERFYGEGDFANSIRAKQELMRKRLYAMRDNGELPNEVVEQFLAYI